MTGLPDHDLGAVGKVAEEQCEKQGDRDRNHEEIGQLTSPAINPVAGPTVVQIQVATAPAEGAWRLRLA
ncbi:MAG: hypothetical protein ACRDFX_13730 [Chloroflexota bacterium]